MELSNEFNKWSIPSIKDFFPSYADLFPSYADLFPTLETFIITATNRLSDYEAWRVRSDMFLRRSYMTPSL
jgi:hypothetical protein